MPNPGDWVFRCILIVPTGAKLTGVVSWLATNLDASESAANWPLLSATGAAPATHAWSNRALTDPEARALLLRCCDLVNNQQPGTITKPSLATWNGWTKAQKRTWLLSVRNSMWTVYGIGVWLAVQDGAWDDPEAALAAAGLVRVSTTGVGT